MSWCRRFCQPRSESDRVLRDFGTLGPGVFSFGYLNTPTMRPFFVKEEVSLCRLFGVIDKYERGSGAKLNASNSEAMWFGRWRAIGATPFRLKWVPKIRILGLYVSNGLVSV